MKAPWAIRVFRVVVLLCGLPVCLATGQLVGAGPLAAPLLTARTSEFHPLKIGQMGLEIDRALREQRLPGAVLWIEHQGHTYHQAFGLRAVIPASEIMTLDTIFDVASLTKVLATTPALMLLQERGRLDIHRPVSAYLPELRSPGKEGLTLLHLLTHTSGFRRALGRPTDWSDSKKVLELFGKEEPATPPGTAFLYSDLNFILLGAVVERVSGTKLDQFVTRELYEPLEMKDTAYLPPAGKRDRIAPTEKRDGEMLRGKVHDPKAFRMGGVAGHAGVFTTAADLARFARMLLHGGELDGVRIFQPETVRLMTEAQTPPGLKVRRGLGWDIDSEFSRPRGEVFPIGSYGHTGFTGVSIWIDPGSETFWIFLCNRLHPNPSGNIYALQKKLGTLAAEAIRAGD